MLGEEVSETEPLFTSSAKYESSMHLLIFDSKVSGTRRKVPMSKAYLGHPWSSCSTGDGVPTFLPLLTSICQFIEVPNQQ